QGRAYNLDGNYYGFIDASGNTVVPHIYTDISLAQGYDKNGLAVVIMVDRVKYQSVERFDESTARYGLIDVNGNYIIPLRKCENILYYLQEGDYYLISGMQSLNQDIIVYRDGKASFVDSGGFIYKKCLEGDIFTEHSGIVNIKTGEIIYSGDTPHVKLDTWGGPWGAPRGGSDIIHLDGRPYVLGYIYHGYDYWDVAEKFGMLDKSGIVLDFEYDYLQWVGGYFCAAQGNYGGLINADGTWFVKVEFAKIIE
ncbi:MAG: WG repeat-containing protein, partial [Clostridiales bacterium]|nr:WG repeat-containing protein [Clostridiales bacterium]